MDGTTLGALLCDIDGVILHDDQALPGAHGLLGWLQQDPVSGRYQLGLRLFELGTRALDNFDIRSEARRVMAEIWLIPFDDAAEKPHRIDPARLTLTPALRRGGGTAFAPAIAMAARLQPSVAVILTDLDGDPGPTPRFPGLWAVPDDRGIPPPPFGRVLSMAR